MEKGVEIFVNDPIIYDKSQFYSEMDDKCDLFFRIVREWDVTLSEMYVYVNLNEHDDMVIYHGYSVKKDLSELFTGLDHSVRVIRFSKIRDMIRTKYTQDNAAKTLDTQILYHIIIDRNVI